jgi:hypothetical protein
VQKKQIAATGLLSIIAFSQTMASPFLICSIGKHSFLNFAAGTTPHFVNGRISRTADAELRLASGVCSISRATARTHLSRIFDKTGTRRQAELVRVLIFTKNIRGKAVRRAAWACQ